MEIMGTNRGDFDADPGFLVTKALEFADVVSEQGIAELPEAWIVRMRSSCGVLGTPMTSRHCRRRSMR
jgi:hypothetical protein